jgi:signal transduction histidine kinase/HPt (histidine-containing phosphotransfer) domain-containing protein
MTEEMAPQEKSTDSAFAGRIDILYALGRHYLSLPFAVLCVPATMIAGHSPSILPLMPLLLQLIVVIAAEQLTTAYNNRSPGSDPRFWARRYTFVSAISGATWGAASLFWFVPGSFPAQAYLSLAFLGMTATEFIARSAHRPAYIAHTLFALGPLVTMLALEGGLYASCSALLVTLFATVLISYCHGMARLLDESIRLRNENGQLVIRLQREKGEAISARESAESSARAKTAFIANMSHELRTPLNALLGMAQLLERAEMPKQQKDHIKVMLQAGRGLQTLIDDVIALTRDDVHSSDDEDCDPLQSARVVARLLQPRAWEKRLHLTLSAAPDLPRVAADPRRVRQVLLKLTDNALKFTEHGLVDIRIDVTEDGHGVRFCISDTGPGVAPQLAGQLFKPFSLGDISYARKQQGAGLGLAVAKRVIEQAGGTIGFASKPDQGAEFFFTLPVSGVAPKVAQPGEPTTESASETAGELAKDLAREAARESENRVTPPTGISVLLFLPIAAVSDAAARMLEPFGNRVVWAGSQSEAQELASREHFDAIIASGGDSDMLAAAPGVNAQLIAILLQGERAPACTRNVLRWPTTAEQLYRVLEQVCHAPAHRAAQPLSVIDPVAFGSLEKSLGAKALVEILQCYIVTAEQLTGALSGACRDEKWDEAARLAQDIIGAAGGLGLSAITGAARDFARKAREGHNQGELSNAAQTIAGEHVRTRQALLHLYPNVA